MLRLMHVVLSLDPGGTERLVIEMSKRLRDEADIQICCLDNEGAWARELSELDIPIHALKRKPGLDLRAAARIAKLARKHRTKVLHCHHYSPYVYAALSRLLYARPRVVYTEHGRFSDAPPSRKRQIANFLLGRLPGRFFAVSEDLAQHVIGEGFPRRRVGVIHNGIEPGGEPSAETRKQARRKLDIHPDAFVFGTIARLDPVKNITSMLDAFSATATELPGSVLLIIGDGPEGTMLQKAAEARGISGRVCFSGHRDDARSLLPAFDCYVNSSISEGISVTILEAMAARVPVLATAVGGTPEVIEHGMSGLLVPARDPRQLSHAMRRLAASPAIASQLGEQGRLRVLGEFSLARMVDDYRVTYNAVGNSLP